MFIGSIFFEFIGAATRWIFLAIKCKFQGKKTVRFSKLYFGNKRTDSKGKIEYAFSNIMLGMIVVVLIMSAIIYIAT